MNYQVYILLLSIQYLLFCDLYIIYICSDGQIITIGTERFRAPEILFQPNLIGLSMWGVHDALFDSIRRCTDDYDLRKEMYGNIILSGGSTMFYGTAERMITEMTAKAPSSCRVKIGNKDEREKRKCLSYIGGAIMASQSSFTELLITADEYEEYGPSIVHRRCF